MESAVIKEAVVSPTPNPSVPSPAPGQLSADQAQQLLSALAAVVTQLQPVAQVLDPSDKKHLAKSRNGIEQQLPLLVSLATKYNVSLPSYPLDEFASDQAVVTALLGLQTPTLMIDRLLADTLLATRARIFSAATTVYAALLAIGQHDSTLAVEILPLRQFFTVAVKKPKKPKTGSPVALAPSSGTSSAAPASPAGGSPPVTVTPITVTPLAVTAPAIVAHSHERRREPRLEIRR